MSRNVNGLQWMPINGIRWQSSEWQNAMARDMSYVVWHFVALASFRCHQGILKVLLGRTSWKRWLFQDFQRFQEHLKNSRVSLEGPYKCLQDFKTSRIKTISRESGDSEKTARKWKMGKAAKWQKGMKSNQIRWTNRQIQSPWDKYQRFKGQMPSFSSNSNTFLYAWQFFVLFMYI